MNLVNVKKFKNKIRHLKAPTITLTAADAKALDADMDALLAYTVELQDKVIRLYEQGQNVTDVQIGGGDFFGD